MTKMSFEMSWDPRMRREWRRIRLKRQLLKARHDIMSQPEIHFVVDSPKKRIGWRISHKCEISRVDWSKWILTRKSKEKLFVLKWLSVGVNQECLPFMYSGYSRVNFFSQSCCFEEGSVSVGHKRHTHSWEKLSNILSMKRRDCFNRLLTVTSLMISLNDPPLTECLSERNTRSTRDVSVLCRWDERVLCSGNCWWI